MPSGKLVVRRQSHATVPRDECSRSSQVSLAGKVCRSWRVASLETLLRDTAMSRPKRWLAGVPLRDNAPPAATSTLATHAALCDAGPAASNGADAVSSKPKPRAEADAAAAEAEDEERAPLQPRGRHKRAKTCAPPPPLSADHEGGGGSSAWGGLQDAALDSDEDAVEQRRGEDAAEEEPAPPAQAQLGWPGVLFRRALGL